MKSIFWMLLVAVISYNVGDLLAHTVIKTECDRLGKFYIGQKVYNCSNSIQLNKP